METSARVFRPFIVAVIGGEGETRAARRAMRFARRVRIELCVRGAARRGPADLGVSEDCGSDQPSPSVCG